MYSQFFSYCIHQTDSVFKDHVLIVRVMVTIVMILLAIAILPLLLYSRYKVLEEERRDGRKVEGSYEEDFL